MTSRTRRFLTGALQLSGLVAVALTATVIGFSTPQGHLVIEEGARRGLQLILAPGFTVDRVFLRWDTTGRLRIERFVLRAPDGDPMIDVDRLDTRLDLSGWRERRVVLDGARLGGVEVALDSDVDGTLDIVRAFGGPKPADPTAEPWGGLPIDLVIRDLVLQDGAYRMRKRPMSGAPGSGPSATLSPADQPPPERRELLDIVAISARGEVELPRGLPEVRVFGAHVQGHLLRPGPLPVAVAGDVTWTGDGLVLNGVRVDSLRNALAVDGRIDALSTTGQTRAKVQVERLDLHSLDALLHAGLTGDFKGELSADGPLSDLLVRADLRGVGATPGRITLGEGTAVCLPRPTAGPDACGGPAGDDPELRWAARLGMEHVQLESILPVVRGPLRLEGELVARGHGTRWPDGVFVDDARWTGEDLDVFGIRIRDLAGGIRLEDGVLRLDQLALTGVAGTVRGSGSVDLLRGRVHVDAYGPLDLTMLQDLGVTDLSGVGRYTAAVDVDWKRPGVPVHASGEIWATDFRYTDGVHIEDAHATYTVDVLRGVTEVGANVDARRLHTYGALTPTARVPDLRVRVDETIDARGTVAAPELLYADLIRATAVRAPFVFVRPRRGGVPVVDATVALGPSTIVTLPSTHGDLIVHLVDKDLRLDVDLRYDADPFLVAPGVSVDLEHLAIVAPKLLFAPTARQSWAVDRPLRLRVTDGGVAETELVLRSDQGRIQFFGAVGTAGPISGSLDIDQLELWTLADLAPDTFGDLYGTLDLATSFDGRADHPHVVVDNVRVEELYLTGIARYAELRGDAELTPGSVADRLRVDVIGGVAGSPLFQLRGHLPVRGDLAGPGLSDAGDVDLDLVLFGGDLERLEKLTFDHDLPDGRLSATAQLIGPMRDPDLLVRGVLETPVEGLADPARLELELTRDEGKLAAHVDAYEGLHTVAIADGTAQTRITEVMSWILGTGEKPDLTNPELFASDLDVALTIQDLSVATLQALAGSTFDADGQLTGTFRAKGSPVAPELRSDLHLRGRAGRVDLDADVVLGAADAVASADPACKVELTDGYAALLRLGPQPAVPRVASAAAEARRRRRDDDEDDGAITEAGPAAPPWVRVCGEVPIRVRTLEDLSSWIEGDLSLTVDGAGLPLSLLSLFDPGFDADQAERATSGRGGLAADSDALRVTGSITGSLFEPQPNLFFGVQNADLAYLPLGLALSDLNLSGSLAPDPARPEQLLLSIETLDALTAPAAVSFQGLSLGAPSRVGATATVVLDEGELGEIRGRLDLFNAWVLGTDDTQLRATGAFDIHGRWPALNLDGRLDVDQGFFQFDAASLLETRNQRLDPDIVVHRGERAVREAPNATPSLFDGLDIDVKLDLGRNTRAHIVMPVLDDLGALGAQFTRADIEARTGGTLDVHIARGVPEIEGQVVLREGEFKLLRADFELDSDSAITFLGADYAEPRLDIRGVMSVTGGEVEVEVTGTAGAPRVDFSSEAFGEDGALLAVFTGQAPDELSSQQASAAFQALSDLLLNSVLGGLNLGTVSVESDGTIHFGLPVHRTLYVESLFKPVPQLNQNRLTVIAEWSLLRNVLITAAYGDRRVWGNFFWERKF